MFARVLIDSDVVRMSIDWLGAGKLAVTHLPSGQTAVASPELKSYFLQTCESLQRRGVQMVPNNPVMAHVFVFFAGVVLAPHDLRNRAALTQHPHELAAALLSELAE